MAAYNFKKRFVPKIQDGTKGHTIRADRADGRIPKIGEPLYLFCGMRTKNCFRILPDAPPCKKIERISITVAPPMVIIDGHVLDSDERERLAVADGFDSFRDMIKFWNDEHGASYRFTGNIIHWR